MPHHKCTQSQAAAEAQGEEPTALAARLCNCWIQEFAQTASDCRGISMPQLTLLHPSLGCPIEPKPFNKFALVLSQAAAEAQGEEPTALAARTNAVVRQVFGIGS